MFRRVSVLFCRFACSVSMSVFHCSICLVMYVSPICCSHAFTASVPSRVTLSICCSVSSLVTVSMLFILFVLRPAFSVFMSYSLVSGSVSVCGCVHCNLCSSGLRPVSVCCRVCCLCACICVLYTAVSISDFMFLYDSVCVCTPRTTPPPLRRSPAP